MSERLLRAVDALSSGRPIVLGGQESILVAAAQLASPAWIAHVVRHTSGILRFAADAALLDRLELADGLGVDAATRAGSGVSATDRAWTLRVLADRASRPSDLVRPGHVFPVRATAATGVRLTRLAGLRPAAAVAELLDDDGAPAGTVEACRFADRHDLEFLTADDLRGAVLRLADARLPTRHGDFRAAAFATPEHPDRHQLALVHGDPAAAVEPLVRVHAACPAGERFGSLVCDCAVRLGEAMREIAAARAGVLVYLRGAEDELVTGLDRCARREPDESLAAAILDALGVGRTVRSGP
ncbi:3,4-dihydroxy-2-butanone-4-phosphate synthase [Solirubrobacter ginsenosidimutans]|uniref:3,4-dihydroxy-2-butanone-4-phosphate synthase n=1 Tax=Solirubrobacter ginsenosidimutans TaxID=490573 RepID=A0A9X3MMN3_9ACTN|nr:3,4-dihydroxy-2-butanone-4-phosphate synthase [Solirubrobacter ginsenosidimutans]MDA0159411.1 3,4-dihydroxy-2-butanone-4-phosphate synthase [Solirubrobacter ginsenosidimutans]